MYGYLPVLRLQDEPVPVHGDHEDGEGGEEDAGGLETAQQFADKLLGTFYIQCTGGKKSICLYYYKYDDCLSIAKRQE